MIWQTIGGLLQIVIRLDDARCDAIQPRRYHPSMSEVRADFCRDVGLGSQMRSFEVT